MDSTQFLDDPIEVLESSERYEEIDGRYQFTKSIVVLRVRGQLYHGKMDGRLLKNSQVDRKDVHDIIPIPNNAHRPQLQSFISKVPLLVSADYYIKRPSLLGYDGLRRHGESNQIAQRVLDEVLVYEQLRISPHPNLVTYLGCEVCNGLISGICLAKYPETLMERVNPRSLMKRAFKFDKRTIMDRERLLKGVKSGITHLHSLGFVHNDLNPSNIMLLEDETPVVIDFDSCRRIGDSLRGVGRTYEWYDEKVEVSSPKNDLDALKEIAEWMGDKDEKEYQFAE